MLSAYLRSKESIDVSFERRMTGADLNESPVFQPKFDSGDCGVQQSSTTDQHCNENYAPKRTRPTELELDLDKFMASFTASESPDAVIYTIIGTKKSKSSKK